MLRRRRRRRRGLAERRDSTQRDATRPSRVKKAKAWSASAAAALTAAAAAVAAAVAAAAATAVAEDDEDDQDVVFLRGVQGEEGLAERHFVTTIGSPIRAGRVSGPVPVDNEFRSCRWNSRFVSVEKFGPLRN